jgi:hypothetical protein
MSMEEEAQPFQFQANLVGAQNGGAKKPGMKFIRAFKKHLLLVAK